MTVVPSQSFVERLKQANVAKTFFPRISWGLLLALLIGAFAVTLGLQTSIVLLLGIVLVVFCAWRLPYLPFYALLATAPMLGWLVSLSTGTIKLGERAFGGSIDIPVADLVVFVTLATWGLRILFSWRGKGERLWKPWLPLVIPYGILVLVHLLTIFSPAEPDPILVLKYSLRPVLFAYLASVVLPVNFIQSRSRLRTALGLLTVSGLIVALDGFISLFIGGGVLYRAHPLPWFGVYPIGENHNVLAEWLLFTAPVAVAYGALSDSPRLKRFAWYAAAFMGAIALLTFARSAWITAFVEIVFLCVTVWREDVKRSSRAILMALIGFSPLALYMVIFSSRSEVQSSTDARAMLAGIGLQLFRESPLVGVGAGTFTDHVARTWIFTYEFGAALDSHGYLQKLAAETGILGLLAFAGVVAVLGWYLLSTWRVLRLRPLLEQHIFAFLCASTIGAFVYQIFNTTYWTPKLWLPVGITLATSRILLGRLHVEKDEILSPLT